MSALTRATNVLSKSIADLRSTLSAGNVRESAQAVAQVIDDARKVGAALVPGSSGRERLRHHFKAHVGLKIGGRELMAIAGIQEFARRIRELRVEEGFQILSGVTLRQQAEAEAEDANASDFRVDDYILLSPEPDTGAAEKWKTANEIRRRPDSVKSKVLSLLQAYVGETITSEELIYVANDKSEWARRARELRTEEGWQVMTHYSGRPDLKPGLYVLESLERAPVHDRTIPDATRRYVLQRDSYTCQECGWKHSNWNKDDPRRLELHHIQHHVDKGSNEQENLITLCNICHDGYHSKSDRL